MAGLSRGYGTFPAKPTQTDNASKRKEYRVDLYYKTIQQLDREDQKIGLVQMRPRRGGICACANIAYKTYKTLQQPDRAHRGSKREDLSR